MSRDEDVGVKPCALPSIKRTPLAMRVSEEQPLLLGTENQNVGKKNPITQTHCTTPDESIPKTFEPGRFTKCQLVAQLMTHSNIRASQVVQAHHSAHEEKPHTHSMSAPSSCRRHESSPLFHSPPRLSQS